MKIILRVNSMIFKIIGTNPRIHPKYDFRPKTANLKIKKLKFTEFTNVGKNKIVYVFARHNEKSNQSTTMVHAIAKQ